MRDLDVKPQNYKTPKENTGENDYDFRFGKGFTATNTKIIIHTIKKSVNWAFPKSETSAFWNTLLGEWRNESHQEKIFMNPAPNKGLVTRINKDISKPNTKKANNSIQKWQKHVSRVKQIYAAWK